MVASKGRAARLGERALGHLDPGAASALVILKAMALTFCDGDAGLTTSDADRGTARVAKADAMTPTRKGSSG